KVRGMSEQQVINDVILASQPTHRFITSEQVAEMVLFLCSDAASGITGSSFSIDGGWTAR
uniref:SDR family oxidoreductase n=1 Tax=Blastomonas sp. UPD001 TaxID=2217673 RepID=UPI000E356CCB